MEEVAEVEDLLEDTTKNRLKVVKVEEKVEEEIYLLVRIGHSAVVIEVIDNSEVEIVTKKKEEVPEEEVWLEMIWM